MTSRDYGACRWLLVGQPLGPDLDAYSPTIGMRALPVTVVELAGARPTIRLEATGKADRSGGYFAGLDALVLRRVR